MSSKHGKCSFQEAWLTDPEFKMWIQRAPHSHYYATCKFCPTPISVSSMGQALTSHQRGTKHKAKIQAITKSPPVNIFFQPKASTSTSPATTTVTVNQPQQMQENLFSSSCNTTELSEDSGLGKQGLKKYLLNENVTKAEVLWCLQTVVTHQSIRSAAKDISILKLMFSDSEISKKKKMEFHRTKISYSIVLGLAVYFRNELINVLKNCDFFVIAFDEALNKTSQRQQMDLVVRFWSFKEDRVVTSYFTSAFLTRGRAVNLLEAFKSALKELDLKKLLQVSMDGPNVNFAFLKELKQHLKEDINTDKQIIDFGSCGIHTVHCAFKNAILATGWDLAKFLRAIYNLFKDVPARRGIFIKITRSETFPLKFCTVRWLENQNVAQRAIEMLPSLRKFVEGVDGTNEAPNSASYKIVKESLKDPMLGPKLAFFKTLAADIEPFLTDFQSNWPLAPFLHRALSTVVETAMERFVKPEVISLSVDLKTEVNLLHHNKINLGFTTQSGFKKCKNLKDSEISEFRKNCKSSLKVLVTKIMERSPLNYKITKHLTCFDPSVVLKEQIGQQRLDELLKSLVDLGWVSGTCADRAFQQYKEVITSSSTLSDMAKFNRKKDRLDDFWIKLLSIHDSHKELKTVLKIVLTLSHGNAEPERGFSVNRECLIENLQNDTLVGYRTVYDAVKKFGGVEQVPLTKSLLNSMRSASSLYKDRLDKRRKEANELEKEKSALKRKKALLKEIKEKKAKLLQDHKLQVICWKSK